MARLLSDHRSAIDLHQTVEVLYQGWIASGGMSAQGAERLQSATTHLKHLYEEHIQIEEGVIFPRAAQALDSDSITAIGQEFRARRA
jgi:hemerythrin-like domain-containing protein